MASTPPRLTLRLRMTATRPPLVELPLVGEPRPAVTRCAEVPNSALLTVTAFIAAAPPSGG